MAARCTAKCVIENGRCKYCGSTQLEILATDDTCLRSDLHPVHRSQLQELQSVVVGWATLAFTHKQMTDPKVRALRLLEEAAEFAQAVGVDFQQMRALVNYVYARPKGDPAQELGGVGITWLAAAHSINTTAEKCLEDEIERVKSKPIGEFTARNQAKVEAGFGPVVHMFGHTYETRNKKYEIDEVMALILFEAVLTGSLQKATNCFAEGIAAGRIKEVVKGDE